MAKATITLNGKAYQVDMPDDTAYELVEAQSLFTFDEERARMINGATPYTVSTHSLKLDENFMPFYIGYGNAIPKYRMKCLMVSQGYTAEIVEEQGEQYIIFKKDF